jgi:DNA polymerase (family 10)
LLAAIRGDAADRELFAIAADLVRRHGVQSDSDLGPLLDSPPPADPNLLRRLQHMYDAGAWVLLESAIADLPADLRWLYESDAVSIEQLAAIHRALGLTSLTDLTLATDLHEVRALAGMSESVEAAIRTALPSLRANLPRIPLGRAADVADPLLIQLKATPGVAWTSTAGSLRRGQDTVGDVELVAAADNPDAAIDALAQLPEVSRCLHRGSRRLYLLFERVQVGVRFPTERSAPATLLMLTGNRTHTTALRSIADNAGLRLTVDGLFGADGAQLPCATEEDIYRALGLPFIPPEIRNGNEELQRGASGSLPTLVTRGDIRGDLHMHTLWSDGRDTVAAMVDRCAALGYEYMAITDHSPHSSASRNLTIDGIKRQADEIDNVRGRYKTMTILHGCEADILADGTLDFPDRVLERFDIVLASLHDAAGHSPDQLMRRYVAAMNHPLVTIITHPTNRLVPYRRPYDLDYDRLFETAVATGTVLEIDGAPAHLDMDGALARRAIDAGVMVSIDSDSHRAEMLDRQMELGLTTARRGWVEPCHVVNTRPLADVRALIDAKRRR